MFVSRVKRIDCILGRSPLHGFIGVNTIQRGMAMKCAYTALRRSPTLSEAAELSYITANNKCDTRMEYICQMSKGTEMYN
jgi:hypothetical protein